MRNENHRRNSKRVQYRFKYLSLVTRTIAIKRERTIILTHGLLREIHTSTDRDLGADDSENRRGGNVHRTTLPVGNSEFATKKLGNDTFECHRA
jgi:hypothetical protein